MNKSLISGRICLICGFTLSEISACSRLGSISAAPTPRKSSWRVIIKARNCARSCFAIKLSAKRNRPKKNCGKRCENSERSLFNRIAPEFPTPDCRLEQVSSPTVCAKFDAIAVRKASSVNSRVHSPLRPIQDRYLRSQFCCARDRRGLLCRSYNSHQSRRGEDDGRSPTPNAFVRGQVNDHCPIDQHNRSRSSPRRDSNFSVRCYAKDFSRGDQSDAVVATARRNTNRS